jgi:predicted 3-demethylubiquinone-9 3-methyltransferase (glyoxalase superfamily)
MCIDSNVKHQFSFTPSFSIFVTCDTEEEINCLYQKLIDGGQALMHICDYGFSKKLGWLNDRFGVPWQRNLPFMKVLVELIHLIHYDFQLMGQELKIF